MERHQPGVPGACEGQVSAHQGVVAYFSSAPRLPGQPLHLCCIVTEACCLAWSFCMRLVTLHVPLAGQQ